MRTRQDLLESSRRQRIAHAAGAERARIRSSLPFMAKFVIAERRMPACLRDSLMVSALAFGVKVPGWRTVKDLPCGVKGDRDGAAREGDGEA